MQLPDSFRQPLDAQLSPHSTLSHRIKQRLPARKLEFFYSEQDLDLFNHFFRANVTLYGKSVAIARFHAFDATTDSFDVALKSDMLTAITLEWENIGSCE